MADHLALKKLAPSDLTFFERLYRRGNKSGQKCINLNADVFIAQFYRDLDDIAGQTNGEVRVGLTIFGPSNATPYNLTRKITKGKRKGRRTDRPQKQYKNWRLNGEFIYDPEDQPGRFDVLSDYDLALLAFDGKPAPTQVTLFLLAKDSAGDAPLFRALEPLVARGPSMRSVTTTDLITALESIGADLSHPLYAVAGDNKIESALEDVAQGGYSGTEFLRQRRSSRAVTQEELDAAKRSAEVTGADGELLIDDFLSDDPLVLTHVWEAKENAISPFDFTIHTSDEIIRADVKSTKGPFENPFHLSMGELVYAAHASEPYVIYRVYRLTNENGLCRISEDIRPFANALLAAHDGALPRTVRADGFSVNVSALSWKHELTCAYRDDLDDEADH
jgi:hypothetical protein